MNSSDCDLKLSSSGDSLPNIQRRTPRKLRSPTKISNNNWQLVGPQRSKHSSTSQKSRSQPLFDISSQQEFPKLPVSPHSTRSTSRTSSPGDPFRERVKVALR